MRAKFTLRCFRAVLIFIYFIYFVWRMEVKRLINKSTIPFSLLLDTFEQNMGHLLNQIDIYFFAFYSYVRL